MIGTHSQDGNCIYIFILCSYYWYNESIASEWKCPCFGLISPLGPVQTKEKQEQKRKYQRKSKRDRRINEKHQRKNSLSLDVRELLNLRVKTIASNSVL